MGEHEYFPERRRRLTNDDVAAIVSEMKDAGLVHQCRFAISEEAMGKLERFADALPEKFEEDYPKLMEFVRFFYEGAAETRKSVRHYLAKAVAWLIIGSILGWTADKLGILAAFMKAISAAAKKVVS